jgi:hypothetical protein
MGKRLGRWGWIRTWSVGRDDGWGQRGLRRVRGVGRHIVCGVFELIIIGKGNNNN